MAQPTVNTMLEQSPLPKLIESLAVSIANAQLEMDKHSIEIVKLMGDREKGIEFKGGGGKRSMLELGFTPSFYHFTETTIRAKVAFSSAQSEEFGVGGEVGIKIGVFSASVNASYSNKYSFTAEGSSEISTRIVSLPPPAGLTRLISESIAEGRPIELIAGTDKDKDAG
jgi:hypothetical protein